MEEFRKSLSEDELSMMNVVKCKSHQPTLLCIVNESHSVKKHFCEKELGSDPIKEFFGWIIDEVVKPTNSLKI